MAAASTIRNLAVGPETRCIIQGFTGKMSTFHTKLSLSMGTNIVGGVSPGKGGQIHLDRPVYSTVKEAVQYLKPHATGVFVPAALSANAIIEAIEYEIPLIVAVAEGIPLHDQMRIMSVLHSQSKSRLIGANSPGMSNPAGCRLGISPVNVAKPGPIGIAARSGTLSYEASYSTKSMGQSFIFGLGGDFYPGTRTAEAVEFFMGDEATQGIVLVGEVGGTMEEDAAELIKERYLDSNGRPLKPIVGFIAGRNVPPGQIFGHSGAIWRDGLGSADQKRKAWQDAGIVLVDAIGEVGEAIKAELDKRSSS
jgi:succinyl-CoA synthetase alpha subunit